MEFSGKQFPKHVIVMAVRWYLAYALIYRNIEELIKEWNIGLDHSSVQRQVAEYGSWLQFKVSKYLTRNFKRSWRLDETYINARWRMSQSFLGKTPRIKAILPPTPEYQIALAISHEKCNLTLNKKSHI